MDRLDGLLMDSLSKQTIFRDYTSSSGIYPKEQMNRMGRMLNNIKGQDGVRVDATPYGITIHGTGNLGHYRFEIVGAQDDSGDPVCRVYKGLWTRNGDITELATDVDQEYQTIDYADLTTDSDNYIYLEIDDAESPLFVTLETATTKPSQTENNTIWILGNFALDADNNVTRTQYWTGGDIDDVFSGGAVDSDMECALTESLETAECDTSSSDSNDLSFKRISGFKNPTTTEGIGTFGTDESEYVVLCRRAGNGSTTASVMRYWIPVDIDVVTNVTYSTSTHKLEMTKSSITVFKQVADESNPITITTAAGCT